MKQITMDWDKYTQEIEKSFNNGRKAAFELVIGSLERNETFHSQFMTGEDARLFNIILSMYQNKEVK